MKTLKSLATALLIILTVSAFATDETKNKKLLMENAVNSYIDALSYGKIKGLSSVIDQEAKFTISYGETIRTYGKSEMLESLRAQENIVQNCKSDYTMIESSPAQAIVKVVMKYDTFSKTHFLTLSNTSKGWKITNVSSSFN